MPNSIDRVFLDSSIRRLRLHLSRIEVCLDKLSEDQIWYRGSENSNAVGNLVLHLCGNLGQWIGFGVGGRPDVRTRDAEFAAHGGVATAELKRRLAAAVDEVATIIEPLTAERLGERTQVQNYDVTVLEAIYHVVEHFALHTGQIQFATKALTGEDLGFYRHLSKPRHAEPTP